MRREPVGRPEQHGGRVVVSPRCWLALVSAVSPEHREFSADLRAVAGLVNGIASTS